MTRRNKSFFVNPLLIVTLGLGVVFATACGDDDDSSGEAPKGGSKATAGTGGTSSTAGKTGTGGTTSTAGKTNTVGGQDSNPGGAGPVVAVGGEGGGAQPDCTDAADRNCYKCTPETLEQFHNQCPTTGCQPFDNGVLTSLVKGKLPKL